MPPPLLGRLEECFLLNPRLNLKRESAMAVDSAAALKRLIKHATPVLVSNHSPSLPDTIVSAKAALVPASLRHDMIREAAYYLAESRSFEAGHELEDWLAAELQIDELIASRYRY
jgi:hypothetical protein